MGWAGGACVMDVTVEQFKKLFKKGLLTNKEPLKALVAIKEYMENEENWDTFDQSYASDPDLWDAALRAAGREREADDMKENIDDD